MHRRLVHRLDARQGPNRSVHVRGPGLAFHIVHIELAALLDVKRELLEKAGRSSEGEVGVLSFLLGDFDFSRMDDHIVDLRQFYMRRRVEEGVPVVRSRSDRIYGRVFLEYFD